MELELAEVRARVGRRAAGLPWGRGPADTAKHDRQVRALQRNRQRLALCGTSDVRDGGEEPCEPGPGGGCWWSRRSGR